MRKHFIPTLLALTALAFALRLAVSLQLADSPEVKRPNPQTDMATYLRLAEGVREGIFPDHYDYQPLYYTVVLPPLVTADRSPLPRLLFQAALGAATVYVTGLAAALLFGKTCAWVAALLLALSRFHIFYTPFALYEVLQGFWMSLLLLLAILAFRHNRWRAWLGAGAVLALAILTRGNAILYLPLLLVLAIIRNRRQWPKALAIIAATIALAYLPQLPFALRNLDYAGRWTGPSTAGPKVLALGNSPEAPAAGLAYPLTYTVWVQQSDDNTRSMAANIAHWACSHPLPFLELKLRTLLHFWDSEEIPNNVNIHAHGYPYSSLLKFPLLVGFGLLSALALTGLFLHLTSRRGSVRLLLAFVLIFCAATVAFYMLARFRIAILPALAVLASGAVARLRLLVKAWPRLAPQRRQRKALLMILAGVLSGLLTFAAIPVYQLLYEADVHRLIQPEGTALDFGHTALVHDHGPLPLGNGSRAVLPASGTTLIKTFLIPRELGSKLEGKPFTVRLMITGNTAQPTFNPSDITVTHHGETVSPGPPVVRYAFSHFLEVTFQQLVLEPDSSATVTFRFPSAGKNYPGIVLDTLRNYGRTAFSTAPDNSPQPLPAEPFAELQADLAHP